MFELDGHPFRHSGDTENGTKNVHLRVTLEERASETFFPAHPIDAEMFESVPISVAEQQTENPGAIAPAHLLLPPERTAIVKADQTGLTAISKTFSQQLLELNGSGSFIPKHKANREWSKKESDVNKAGWSRERRVIGRGLLCRRRPEWPGNF